MRQLYFFAIIALSACAFADDVHYTDKYDNLDLDQLLGNRRLLVPYIKCILEQGKCSPDGRELKSHIKEALESHCAKCTQAQQQAVRRVFGHLVNSEPAYWQQIVAKYDPQRKYVVKYEQELRQIMG